MKKSPLNKVGKIGKANIEARKRIAEIAEEKGLNFCEIKLDGCLGGMYLAPAHRHKRSWYKGNVELLADFNEWVCACVSCHNLIEHNEELTANIFKKCR
ncbi:hypothetical protein M0R04_13980 [Candidatus Dojkabacteria bacterium]|jgi:hypothetical protein|nr:hypothetical protein [Candidatus Dojkabacteria bacterium]